ncbi:MarR family winged helix-turn-helix transcriptional regulator [Janibacter cremeus]|uniref:DNA-binding MarR family transcriptional regulator n=1 Tax=Janibacter cremeus TaxID=1285192 RepID=A0A852VS24_9MICO|nr:MarR family transcriptional regulator [Janibacter cremeus]NYF98678.1 DNA-binding MarR family transcriptional regulator [Janibacter cremeus]
MTDRDPIAEARQQWVSHGWADAADGMALITSITRAQQLLVERVEDVLRPHGLTFARYEILRLLAFSRRRSMPMSRLGSLLQVHATSVTSAVDRLEKQGLAERLRLERDRRVVLASLTTKGAEVVEAATADLNARVFTSPGLDPDQVAAATELLTSLRATHGDTVAQVTAVHAKGDAARLRE